MFQKYKITHNIYFIVVKGNAMSVKFFKVATSQSYRMDYFCITAVCCGLFLI